MLYAELVSDIQPVLNGRMRFEFLSLWSTPVLPWR
jgi:hypothetical protein